MSLSSLVTDATLDRAIDAFWATVPPLWGQVRGRIRATAAERFDLSLESRRATGNADKYLADQHHDHPRILTNTPSPTKLAGLRRSR